MWYLYSVNKGRTLLKFIEYLKALRKIFANVSKFLHVNTKSNVKRETKTDKVTQQKRDCSLSLWVQFPEAKCYITEFQVKSLARV